MNICKTGSVSTTQATVYTVPVNRQSCVRLIKFCNTATTTASVKFYATVAGKQASLTPNIQLLGNSMFTDETEHRFFAGCTIQAVSSQAGVDYFLCGEEY